MSIQVRLNTTSGLLQADYPIIYVPFDGGVMEFRFTYSGIDIERWRINQNSEECCETHSITYQEIKEQMTE